MLTYENDWRRGMRIYCCNKMWLFTNACSFVKKKEDGKHSKQSRCVARLSQPHFTSSLVLCCMSTEELELA